MSETTPDAGTRYRQAREQLLDADGEAMQEARAGFIRSRETIETLISEAVAAGIEEAADETPLTALERYGVESLVDSVADYVIELDESNVYQIAGLARGMAAAAARDRLLRKLLGAWMLEYTVAQADLADGVVGRAVDGAVAQLEPYARAQQPGWWRDVIGEGAGQ